jgi:hypothetical protein
MKFSILLNAQAKMDKNNEILKGLELAEWTPGAEVW